MKVQIETDEMHKYRILSVGTMGLFSNTYCEVLKEIKALKEADEPPTQDDIDDLEMVISRLGTVLRTIDYADKFMVVYGEPLKQKEKHAKLRKQLLPQICHRPLSSGVM